MLMLYRRLYWKGFWKTFALLFSSLPVSVERLSVVFSLRVPNPVLQMPRTAKIVEKDQQQPRLTHLAYEPSDRIFPWSFRSSLAPNESRKAYQRFLRYLELGDGRTITAISNEFAISLPVVCTTSKKNNWKMRAAAYDENIAIVNAEKERQQRHGEHMEKLEAFRSRTEQLGSGLIASAAQLLQVANQSIQEIRARGDVLDQRLISSALQAAAKCSIEGRSLIGSSLGVDALLSGIEDEDGSGERYT